MIDHAFVKQQRLKGFSWQAIAKQLGCCELDLRNECDPSRRIQLPVREPVVAAPKVKAKPPQRQVKPAPKPRPRAPFEARVLRLLGEAYPHYLTPEQLGGQVGYNAVYLLRTAYGGDIIQTSRALGYRLSPRGFEIYRNAIRVDEAA